jgi:hypothetical protein
MDMLDVTKLAPGTVAELPGFLAGLTDEKMTLTVRKVSTEGVATVDLHYFEARIGTYAVKQVEGKPLWQLLNA